MKRRRNFIPKSSAPRSAADVLERTLSAYRLDKKMGQYAAFPEWPEIVGEEIAAVAVPEKIIRGNTLVVKVLDAAWAQELSMLKVRLMESIFQHGFGGTIVDIRFITGGPGGGKA